MWTSITEGPFKPLIFATHYNLTIPTNTKDLPHEDEKKEKLDIKAYIMFDMARSLEI